MNIVVIGAGYVGLVTSACFSEFGYKVLCVDSDKKKINKLKKNIIPIYEPGLYDLVKKNTNSKYLEFSSNLNNVSDASIIFIAVGTPTTRRGDGQADLKYIFQVCKDVSLLLKKQTGKLIVTKSTVPIGTGHKIIEKLKKYRKDLVYGRDYHVASNPEFLREGSAIEDFLRPDRVVCGVTNDYSKTILSKLYRPLNLREVPMLFTDIESAELIKYASNAFLAMKISFINEMSDLCEKVGGKIQLVAKGMGLDNRIGGKFLHPGPGFGGSCFPKDVRALNASFKQNKVKATMINSIIEFNENRKINMFKKVKKILGSNLKNKTIAFLGVTFKPNTDDIRESSSLVIIPSLIKNGTIVKAHDPAFNNYFKLVKPFKEVKWFKNVFSAIRGSDILIIHTEWNEYRALNLSKTKKILKQPNILDFRNIFNKKEMVKLGFNYLNLGEKN